MSHINISQILMKRGNTAAASAYTGPLGELVVDTGLQTLRIQDGVTAGGWIVTGGGGGSSYGNTQLAAYLVAHPQSGTYSNVNVAAYISGNLSTLYSNAAAQATDITTLFGNAAIQATGISTLFGNAAAQADSITALFGNAASQATAITTLFGNAAIQANAISTLQNQASTYAPLLNPHFTRDLTVAGNVIVGNLHVLGNTIITNTTDLAVANSVINLHTAPDLSPWTYDDGTDIGIKIHYYKTQDSTAFLGMSNATGYLEWFDQGTDAANVFVGTNYGTIKTGNVILDYGRLLATNGLTLTAGSASWTLDDAGILNLPVSITNMALVQSTNSIQLNADGSYFTFGADGSLTLGNGARLGSGDANKFATDNTVVTALDLRDTSGAGFYTNGDGYTLRSNGSYNWMFKTDGNLTIPGNINYANGQSILSGISSGGGSGVYVVPNDVNYITDGEWYGIGNSGFTVVNTGDDDSAYSIPVDFPIEFLGNAYSSGNVWLVSNSYLTFGPNGAEYTNYHPVGPVVVPAPAIYMDAADFSNQRYYYGYADGTDVFVIGYEGSVQTGGSPGYPGIKWELQVNSATPDQIQIVVNGPNGNGGAYNFPAGIWGISDGAEWVDQFQPLPWYSNNHNETFNGIVIAPVSPATANSIAFTGPGVTYGTNGDTTFINIDPFDEAITVAYNQDNGESIISSTYRDLTLTTARDGEDLNLRPLGDVNIYGGNKTDNQPGNGHNVYIYGGNAHDDPNSPGTNNNGGTVEIYGGEGVNSGVPGSVNIHSSGYSWEFDHTGVLTVARRPSGPSNQIKYGTGNLVVYDDGQWTIGEFDGTNYGTKGIRVSPGIEGNVEVILPADQFAANNALELNNYAGNVQVRASNNYWIFGGDGNLTIAGNINYANGQSILSGISTATRWDAIPAVEGCPIYAELTPDHFSAYTQHSHLDVNNDGSWDIGSNYLSTGLYSLDNTAVTLYSNLGNVVVRTGDSSQYWTFGGDGELYLPTGGRLGYAGKGWTGLDGGYGNPTSLMSYYSSGMYSSCVTAGPDGSLNISTYGDGTGQTGNWNFSGGAITFPDNTVQTTAYQAGSAGNSITSGNNYASISSTEFRIKASDKSYWIAQFGDITNGNRRDDGNSIVYDNHDNLIVVMTDYAEVPGDNSPKPMVVKYDPEGQVVWKQYLSASGSYVLGSAESVDVDGQDNIYVLTNNYNDGSSGVFKISPTGVLLDQIQINNTYYNSNDIVVDSVGNYYVSGVGPNNGNNQISVIKGNFGGIIWQTGVNYQVGGYDYGYSIAIDSATPPNVYAAGTYNDGGELVKLDHDGNVQWVVTLQYAYFDSVDVDNAGNIYVLASYDGDAIVVKYDNSGNLIWQKDLGQVYNPTEIQVGDDGYLYATGITGNGPFNNAIWMAKLDTDGVVQWVRGLTNQVDYNNIGQWQNNGHKDIAVGNGVFAVTGFSQNSSRRGGGYVQRQAVVAQFPTNGTYALPYDDPKKYLNYSYITLPWMESSSNTSLTAATATFVTADPGYTSTASTANLTVSTLTSSVESVIHGAVWKFNEAGSMVFPDGTEQTTAYPGPGVANGEYTGLTANTGTYSSTPISIKNAAGYKRIDNLGSTPQIWFNIYDDVASQLQINQDWITGVTMDIHVTSIGGPGDGQDYGTLVGQIIIARGYNGEMAVTHTESAIVHGNYGDDNLVFANLDLWQQQWGVQLLAARTDSNTGQQLDIMWTAKVFTNPTLLEQYC